MFSNANEYKYIPQHLPYENIPQLEAFVKAGDFQVEWTPD